jgi:hypothetical protein
MIHPSTHHKTNASLSRVRIFFSNYRLVEVKMNYVSLGRKFHIPFQISLQEKTEEIFFPCDSTNLTRMDRDVTNTHSR